MPDELAVWAVLRKAPPLPFLAPAGHGQDVLVLPIFSRLQPATVQPAIDRIKGSAIGNAFTDSPIVKSMVSGAIG